MGSKNNLGDFDCYHNALPDEPMFILLARDPSAPAIVKWWADAREAAIDSGDRPQSDRAMVEEARRCAKNMRQWRIDNDGSWRSSQVARAAQPQADGVREALEPFASLGGPNDGIMPAFHDLADDVVIYSNSGRAITAGDVRLARQALGWLHAPWPIQPSFSQTDHRNAALASDGKAEESAAVQALREVLRHAQAPNHHASQRLDRIEEACLKGLAGQPQIFKAR